MENEKTIVQLEQLAYYHEQLKEFISAKLDMLEAKIMKTLNDKGVIIAVPTENNEGV